MSRARECADRAVALKPESSTALGALGAAHADQGRLAEAIESYRQGVALPGPSVEMLLSFANALLASGLNEEAIIQLRRALQLDEKNLNVRWAIAIAHLKPVYQSAGEIDVSRREFAQAIEDVTQFCRATAIEGAFNAVGVSQPFYMAYQPFNNLKLLKGYGELCSTLMSTLPAALRPAGQSVDVPSQPNGRREKIRLGIVSAQIHEHSVWNAITRGWVHHLDGEKFELHLFQLNPTSDKETEKARGISSSFTDHPTSLPAWVEAILDKNLDVLIFPEIGMDPLTVRLAAMRLAKVQAASWGHPETTGLPTMDLFISAAAFEPERACENYSEKLIRLPNLGVHVEPLTTSISNPGLRSLNLPGNEPLLLCAGSPFKYSPLYDDVWVEIAKRLQRKFFKRSSGGQLVFFRSRSDSMDRLLEQRLRSVFERHSVDFDAHVRIVANLERSRFFGLMRESALLLDTIGFSGFNTALQAIECDLPVLAFEGQFMRGRLASGMMRLLELPELVATTPEDFVQKAVELAGNASLRRKLRALIVERRHRLFRDLHSVRELERRLTEAVSAARLVPT